MTATKSGVGTYLVDGAGMTLYYFTNDSPGKSAATDAIVKNWPVFFALDLTVSPSLNVADFSPIRRDDGQSQTVFRNWPLYYYVNDTAPGDTNGQGVGGTWFVIDPNNFPPAGTPGATTTAPSSTVSPAATPTVSPTPMTPSPTPASTATSSSANGSSSGGY
jgi:predicted lipoprotein with Yx(FWY)xxD motif